jgi:pyruvate carboxylase
MGLGHRWPEIARTYAEVNELLGDIVKVTPSSKVVGDMALFLFTRGIKPADVVNLEPGVTPFPDSVKDMLRGGLGQPMGGWPKAVQRVVLGNEKPLKGRPGEDLPPANLKKIRAELSEKLKHEASEDDLFSHLMYPEVFAEFAKFAGQYGHVSALPTAAFFYGLKPGEEISVDIEEGKTLFVRFVSVGDPDKDGRRPVTYELNGITRVTHIADKSAKAEKKSRAKADPADPLQAGAPIPGIITAINVSVGTKVAKGDKLFTMEAMKMQTTIYAGADGVVSEINVSVGENVESKDLLAKLRI